MNDNKDIEFIKQEVMRIGVKLDTLPQIYVTRVEHDPWRATVEKRLDNLEGDAKERMQWENSEHTKLAAQVVESERRIIEKIDGNSKLSLGMKVTLLLSGIGWIISIVEFVLNFVIHR